MITLKLQEVVSDKEYMAWITAALHHLILLITFPIEILTKFDD